MVIQDTDKCTKSPTGEHVWNYTPRPDNCRFGTCRYCEQQRVFEGAVASVKQATHTAALLKPTPVKPETMAKLAKRLSERGEIKPRAKIVPRAKTAVVEKDNSIEPKKNGHNRIAVVYDNQHRGNLALQLLRLKRGELRPQSIRPVMHRYKSMLEYDLSKAQKQVRDTKQNIAMVDEALRELDVIQQGEKAVVDKVLAAVR